MRFELLLSQHAASKLSFQAGLGGHWLQGSTACWYHEKVLCYLTFDPNFGRLEITDDQADEPTVVSKESRF